VFTRKAIRDNNQQEKAMRHAHATKPAPLPDDGLPGLPVLDVVDGVPTTTSFTVAEHFKKRHDNVLQAISRLDCSPKFRLLNFKETSFVINMPNGGTREEPAYRLTRDGFVFLCMGFTGKDAALWKERYIEAFNAMEAALRTPLLPDDGLPHVLQYKNEKERLRRVFDQYPHGFPRPEEIALLSRVDWEKVEAAYARFVDLHEKFRGLSQQVLDCAGTLWEAYRELESLLPAGRPNADELQMATIHVDLRGQVHELNVLGQQLSRCVSAAREIQTRRKGKP
jgi:Rha family phage regulatory protein